MKKNMYKLLGPSDRILVPIKSVGFDHYPDQVMNDKVENGFEFNIMCVGASGVGKTSLINTLFDKKILEIIENTLNNECLSLKCTTKDIFEDPVKIKVNIIETVGYGDQLDGSKSADFLVNYIEEQHIKYLKAETKITRKLAKYNDTRIHLCLFFISPTCHFLKSYDIDCIKKLSQKVNVLPIIGKADILTSNELLKFKTNINHQLESNGINTYKFPLNDPATKERNELMNKKLPFAIVSASTCENIDGKMVRLRKYPWGVINIDDELHSEFCHFKEMIIRINMSDLINKTIHFHYENFRNQYLKTHDLTTKNTSSTLKINEEIKKIEKKHSEDIKELNKEYEEKEKKAKINFEKEFAILEAKHANLNQVKY